MRFRWFSPLVLAWGASVAPAASAGDAVEVPSPQGSHANRPPKFLPGPEIRPLLANDLGGTGLPVRAGRTFRATVAAEDPDGDALVYRAQGLPSGASFDE